MSTWELTPFVQVGPLRFGMVRSEVRMVLASKVTTFKKGPLSVTDTDAFTDLKIHCYYANAPDILDYVEFYGNSPAPVCFHGLRLQKFELATLVKELFELSYSCLEDEDGGYFPDLGIAIYSPRKSRIESIGIFERSRFENYLRLNHAIAERRRLRAARRHLGAQ